MSDFGLISASGNPSEASIDDIMRDAQACAASGINGVGNIVKSGLNMYNTVSNAFSNPQAFFNPQAYPYQANMGMPQMIPQAQYAYGESGVGYGSSYLSNMNPQMYSGYPGFADSDYGMGSSMGFSGGTL